MLQRETLLIISKIGWVTLISRFNLLRFAKDGVMRFLVGNKCDLENKRKVSSDEGKDIARQYNIPFFETSAKDTINIEELFLDTTRIFIDRQKSNNVRRDSKKNLKNGISVENINEKKKKSCC
jgi:Ras-related protein Rab-1A